VGAAAGVGVGRAPGGGGADRCCALMAVAIPTTINAAIASE
jgi:hypothetical protein